jgi:uncharacterized membrane protein HdeD (DUF308 family)
MFAMTKELNRLSGTLVVRGVLMLILGVSAAVWPEPLLIAALISVGVIALLSGGYELAVALSLRSRTDGWWLVLLHGGASVAFGLLTLGGPRQPIALALAATAAWLLVYASLAWIGALLSHTRTLRRVLFACALVHVVLAILAIAYPSTVFSLLFFGAIYAAALGAWQIVVGILVRHIDHEMVMGRTTIAQQIESRVRTSLPRGIRGESPSVAVHFDGTCATLTGEVNCWSEHQAAERAALSVHGVRRVDNQLALLVLGKVTDREHFRV